MRTMLELTGVRVLGISTDRLKNVELSVGNGEKIALLGPSGAGKTTLISVANGSLKPHEGNVLWHGKDLSRISSRHRAAIGTLWQELRLIEELNVSQNVNAGALGRHNLIWAIRNLMGLIDSKESLTCLEAAGLNKEMIDLPIKELSGGQRQRVAIARLFRQRAQLLLADEPISNLDPNLSNKILKLLIGKENDITIQIPESVIISLHRPDLIRYFTRIIGIKKGEIIFDLPTEKVNSSEISWLYK